MAVSGLSATRYRSRPAPARLPLVCLYLAVGATGVSLGSWPLKLAALALVATAVCRIALSGQGSRMRGSRDGTAPQRDGGRT
ncbi:hypothetical protein [Streptomyces sp. NPDC096013]|uniref:hypothetical protein n=1 Tax=Streptomyces sp. NPDC096013 TaxID=3366069 RepID=UPI00380008EB